METVCYDAHGTAVSVPVDQITFRPAVYGILLHEAQVLLMRHPNTNLWQPPGAPIGETETLRGLLTLRLQELLGISLRIGPLLYAEERYVLGETQQAWRLAATYYGLERPLTTHTIPTEITHTHAAWVPLDTLTRTQMQFGYPAIQAAQRQPPAWPRNAADLLAP